MTKNSDGSSKALMLPQGHSVQAMNAPEQPSKPHSLWRRFTELFTDSPGTIRRATRRAAAHEELFTTTTLAITALDGLQKTPEKLETRYQQERAQAALDHAVALQEGLNKLRRLQKASERIDAEHNLEQVRVQDAINAIERKQARSAGEKPEPVDPAVRKAAEALKSMRDKERLHREIKRQKEAMFAEIDAEVARGERDADEAEEFKQDMEDQVRATLLNP